MQMSKFYEVLGGCDGEALNDTMAAVKKQLNDMEKVLKGSHVARCNRTLSIHNLPERCETLLVKNMAQIKR